MAAKSAYPLAGTVVMVRPHAFNFNPETAASNPFQKPLRGLDPCQAQALALKEFDKAVAALEAAGVKALVFEDTDKPAKPDAVFPNNWFCTLPCGRLFTFPMVNKTRRSERRDDILSYLVRTQGYALEDSLVKLEGEGRALEGTGSLVFDHGARLAYAALSPRTNEIALKRFEALSGYMAVPFRTTGPDGKPVYHTNVVMTLGPTFAAVGAECIHPQDRDYVLGVLARSGKKILRFSSEQIFTAFAGNMLVLKGREGKPLLVMSEAARTSLTNAEVKILFDDFGCGIASIPIPTIERLGGGSVRCMLAEVF
ncbi:MAG TPA: arginine deiminase-related protein [Sphingomonadales bacterium]|nr:arginine deiminase-related protein [Sphingomonadales bacterium]